MSEYVIPLEVSENFLYHYKAKVVSVYDADTIRLDIDLGFGIWKLNEPIRIARIDAPEIRGAERELGLIARDFLKDRLLLKEVIVRTNRDKSGKYGRYIAEIVHDGVNISDWLVENGHAEYRMY